MENTVRISESIDSLIEFDEEKYSSERFWRLVLTIAVRDSASSLHYHPWRNNSPTFVSHSMTYVVNGIVYGLVPPPLSAEKLLIEAARKLLAPGRFRFMRRLLTGSPSITSGHLLAETSCGTSKWFGACWGANGFAGVDLYRLDLPPIKNGGEENCQSVT
jgi:hypothetical protein